MSRKRLNFQVSQIKKDMTRNNLYNQNIKERSYGKSQGFNKSYYFCTSRVQHIYRDWKIADSYDVYIYIYN